MMIQQDMFHEYPTVQHVEPPIAVELPKEAALYVEKRNRRVAIVGSRSWVGMISIVDFVKSLPRNMIVVTGGAPGADSMAESAAMSAGLTVVVCKANWQKWGRQAGPIRNIAIVEIADVIVAFWDGKSPGTQDTINKAKRAGKRVEICRPGQSIVWHEDW